MAIRTIGIIMNGVTGRMGTNQHLERSILAIRDQGGVTGPDGTVVMPEPLLVGRNEAKLRKLSEDHGGLNFTTDLQSALNDANCPVYFDAQTTLRRYEDVRHAIAAGKHVYCEKPVATASAEGLDLYQRAKAAGVKHGVVQDKLWLPGLRKLKSFIDSGFFGEILSVRGDFGYWVFTGEDQPAQRPSWNYRAKDGGGIILDMFCHWRYVIDNLFGNVNGVFALGATHIKKRWDEQGSPFDCDTDDAAYAIFTTDTGVICQFNSSWCTRVRRDDLVTFQVDGTKGSVVAGLRECWFQSADMTPRPVWNPDIENPIDFRAGWSQAPGQAEYDNAFKLQWELFLRHVAFNEPFRWDLKEGAKGVQLAELGLKSWHERRWIDVPAI
ncbi:MAG: oxidoreductase [Candidatus Hydrogenedentota bacterium]